MQTTFAINQKSRSEQERASQTRRPSIFEQAQEAVTLSASLRAKLQELQRGFWLPMGEDSELVRSIREQHNLTERDNVSIFLVPPSMSHMVGSHLTRPTTSPTYQRLSISIRIAEAGIRDMEVGAANPDLTEEEVARKIHGLRQSVQDNRRALAQERRRLAAMPRSGWIIAVRPI